MYKVINLMSLEETVFNDQTLSINHASQLAHNGLKTKSAFYVPVIIQNTKGKTIWEWAHRQATGLCDEFGHPKQNTG